MDQVPLIRLAHLTPEQAQATVDEQSQPDERQGRPAQCPACGHGLIA